jgi:hypothetical protein
MNTPSVIGSSNATEDDLKAKGGRLSIGRPSYVVLMCVCCVCSCEYTEVFTFNCRDKAQAPDRGVNREVNASTHNDKFNTLTYRIMLMTEKRRSARTE